jgi:glycosyltransferase involved in cell wall biosynthesis
MKVLMLGRLGLLSGGGGDKIQIVNTAKELESLGVTIDVKDSFDFSPRLYDLVHVFQLDWMPESNMYAHLVKAAGKPLVFSPIHHSVSEVKKFDDEYAFGYRKISKVLFKDQFRRDTLKDFYRMFFDKRRVRPVLQSVFKGLKSMHTETLSLADIILVQTKLEAVDLKVTFGVDFTWRIIPNGVGEQFLDSSAYTNPFSFEDYILCVGRIEPRKNQLKIIEAVVSLRNDLEIKPNLVFIGKMAKYKHPEYTARFNNYLRKYSWINHIEQVPYEEISSYYHFAKVGVSASWFETTGLTSLEALFSGANAVASGARAKEYLGGYASYCEPSSTESIEVAIKKEFAAPRPRISKNMKKNYTWKNAAKKTLESYKEVLSHA